MADLNGALVLREELPMKIDFDFAAGIGAAEPSDLGTGHIQTESRSPGIDLEVVLAFDFRRLGVENEKPGKVRFVA